MYRPNVTLTSDVMNYIEGTDIYNSEFISEALRYNANTMNLENKKTDRIDLLANLIYQSESNYAGLLGVINGFDFINFDYSVNKIKYLESSDISKLINKV